MKCRLLEVGIEIGSRGIGVRIEQSERSVGRRQVDPVGSIDAVRIDLDAGEIQGDTLDSWCQGYGDADEGDGAAEGVVEAPLNIVGPGLRDVHARIHLKEFEEAIAIDVHAGIRVRGPEREGGRVELRGQVGSRDVLVEVVQVAGVIVQVQVREVRPVDSHGPDVRPKEVDDHRTGSAEEKELRARRDQRRVRSVVEVHLDKEVARHRHADVDRQLKEVEQSVPVRIDAGIGMGRGELPLALRERHREHERPQEGERNRERQGPTGQPLCFTQTTESHARSLRLRSGARVWEYILDASKRRGGSARWICFRS